MDIAGDMVSAQVGRSRVRWVLLSSILRGPLVAAACASHRPVCCCPPPPTSLSDVAAVTHAVHLLKSAERPLVIVGKGESFRWSRAGGPVPRV